MEGGVLGGLCGGGLRGRGSGRTVCRPSLAMAAKTLAAAAKRRWDGLRCGLRRALCREARRSRARTGRRPRLLRRWPPIPLSSRGPSTSWFVVKDGGGLLAEEGAVRGEGRRGVREVSSPEETETRGRKWGTTSQHTQRALGHVPGEEGPTGAETETDLHRPRKRPTNGSSASIRQAQAGTCWSRRRVQGPCGEAMLHSHGTPVP